jgi:hypothetical protein
MRRPRIAIVALSLSLTASLAGAQSDADRRLARELGEQGADALDKKDFTTALDRFGRADKLFHAPTIGLGLGRALAGSGKLVAALETFHRVATEPLATNASLAFRQAAIAAQKEADALEPRVPTVVITLRGADEANVTIDGERVPSAALGLPRAADPGDHVVRAEAVGFTPASATVTAQEGKRSRGELVLRPASSPPLPSASSSAPPSSGALASAPSPVPPTNQSTGSTQRIAGYVTGALGVVGLAVGGYLALSAKSTYSDSRPYCNGENHCVQAGDTLVQSARSRGDIATGVLAVGVVGLGVGATLLLTAPSSSDAIGLGPSGISWRRTW